MRKYAGGMTGEGENCMQPRGWRDEDTGKEKNGEKNLIHFKCEETEAQKETRQLTPGHPLS